MSGINDPCPNAHVRQQTSASLLLDCRAYELVSAPNTDGFDVESDLTEDQTPYAGYPEAEGHVLYGVHDGGIPGTGNPTDRGVDPYLAVRGADGWATRYVGIPANGTSSTKPFSSSLLEADASLDTLAFGGEEIARPALAPVKQKPASRSTCQTENWCRGWLAYPQPKAKPEGYIGKDLSANGEHLVFGSKAQFEPDGNNNGTDLSIYDRNLRPKKPRSSQRPPRSNDDGFRNR